MFIHWGLYSVPAGEWKGKPIAGLGEWIMNRAKIPVAEYEQLAKQFNPVKFNADEWVAVARSAGAKYIVITSKHHDGFAMYGSKVSRHNIVDATPFHRDPMKELAAACQKAGIKLCFYYSQTQDWHEPDGNGNTWDWPDEFFRLRPQGDGFADREEPRGDGDVAVRRGHSSARFDGHGRGVAQLRSLRTSRGLRADERHRASSQPEIACLGRSQKNNYLLASEVPMRTMGGSYLVVFRFHTLSVYRNQHVFE